MSDSEELTPKVIRALELVREDTGSLEAVERLTRRVDETIGRLAAGPGGAQPIGSTAPQGATLKIIAGTVLGLVGGAALHATLSSPREVIVERRVEVPVKVEVPVPAVVPSPPTAPRQPLPPRENTTPPVRQTPQRPQPPEVQRVSRIEAERLLVERATAALGRGTAAEALLACDEHRQQFHGGQLEEEVESLAIRSLVALGRRDEARARFAGFRLQYPHSLLTSILEASLQEHPASE